MKVLQYGVGCGLGILFLVNDDPDKITRQTLEDERFVRDIIDQDMGFTKGVTNAVHY